MLKAIFGGMRIADKRRFTVYTVLYAVTLLVFFAICVLGGLLSYSLSDMGLVTLLFADMPNAVYHGPVVGLIFAALTFFEILLISWQTGFEGPRLNRFVLFCYGVNLILMTIGLSIRSGTAVMLIVLLILALIIAVPTVIIVKVQEKRGTADFSDIMTPEEIEAYNSRRNSKHRRV